MRNYIDKAGKYLLRRSNYLIRKKNKIVDFSEQHISFPVRILDSIINNAYKKELILTTYFTSKTDPQSNLFVKRDDFNYIKNFYESVVNLNLNAVVFYDNMSRDFINKYSCENVSFVKCYILKYSLNDERFFIYKEFVENTKPEKVILVDINDVTFNKSPFNFIRDNMFYIGRDVHLLMADHSWMLKKIDLLPSYIKSNLPDLFMTMPIVNAGVVGGDYNIIVNFLNKLCVLLARIDNNNNNNMIAVNMVFYDECWLSYHSQIINKINYLRTKNLTTLRTSKALKSSRFVLGKPFTSEFKKYEKKAEVFIYHK